MVAADRQVYLTTASRRCFRGQETLPWTDAQFGASGVQNTGLRVFRQPQFLDIRSYPDYTQQFPVTSVSQPSPGSSFRGA
jgi:hypothetical protein